MIKLMKKDQYILMTILRGQEANIIEMLQVLKKVQQ